MAKKEPRKLGVAAAQSRRQKTALDLAEEVTQEQEKPPEEEEIPEPKAPIKRNHTERISVSLLPEERAALEQLSADLRSKGHRDIRMSRLARIAFKMLIDATEEEVLKAAEDVPYLEKLRSTNKTVG